jgi:hypothetical protein
MNSTESIKEGLTLTNDEPIESLTQVSLRQKCWTSCVKYVNEEIIGSMLSHTSMSALPSCLWLFGESVLMEYAAGESCSESCWQHELTAFTSVAVNSF